MTFPWLYPSTFHERGHVSKNSNIYCCNISLELVQLFIIIVLFYFHSFLSTDLCSPALDRKTAHPKLKISQDGRQVHWRRQPVVETLDTQPYDSQYSVLAQEGFSSGQHYWEVIVQEKPYWLIGVSTGSPDKKEVPDKNYVNSTFWCMYHGDGQYMVLHNNQEKQLSVTQRVKKLGVLANLQKGKLSFYDADTMILLHSFSVQCTEPLFPMLNPCLDVNGMNHQPLTLFLIKDP